MNIDERLERLTERHEALAQTFEIIAGMQLENERRFAERFDRIEAALEKLVTVMESHERRLNKLEGK
jgi:prephenate dehydrogenase